MPKKLPSFDKNIFINCPFDREYLPLLRPLLFTVVECGLEPRIASERPDAGFTKKDIDEMPVTEFVYFIKSWIGQNP